MLTLTLSIGTHGIDLYPISGERLRPSFFWHKPVVIEKWSCQDLEKWAESSANDSDYIMAERNFINCYAPGQARLMGA